MAVFRPTKEPNLVNTSLQGLGIKRKARAMEGKKEDKLASPFPGPR